MVEKEFDSTDEKEEIKIRLSALIKPKLFAPGLQQDINKAQERRPAQTGHEIIDLLNNYTHCKYDVFLTE